LFLKTSTKVPPEALCNTVHIRDNVAKESDDDKVPQREKGVREREREEIE
jgi:hypothetical protein